MTTPSDPAPRHLVGVWNPAYASDAMEATLQLLLAFASRHRDVAAAESSGGGRAAGDDSEDEVYVWWGKVRSPNRQAPMPHRDEILAIEQDLQGEGGVEREVHLYLTDYRSLYVGHVAEITGDDVRADDAEHVPGFYAEAGLSCDLWFRLFDIRRVVDDDTLETVRELQKLRNLRYHGRPVSLYGGMVELPLIVTREDGARYFDRDVREALTDGRFWVEFDASRAGTALMERELRLNLVGEEAWSRLDPAARVFVATAEMLFRAHRGDPAFDFGPVVVDLAKAFEVQVNAVLRQALAGLPPDDRRINIDGRTVDLAATGAMWPLGTLARIIADDRGRNEALRSRLQHGAWFAANLPPILSDLADHRNPAAHSTRVSRDVATALRNRIVGVGCTGALAELGRVRPRHA